jgi:hypothetical protein
LFKQWEGELRSSLGSLHRAEFFRAKLGYTWGYALIALCWRP